MYGPEILTTADPVFLLDPPSEHERAELARTVNIPTHDGPNVAFCLRTLDLRKQSFRDSIVGLSRHILDELGGSIWMLPLQTGGGEDDRIGAHQVAAELNNSSRVRILEDITNPTEALGILSLMDIVVSEKLHGLVFAVQLCKPFLAISYAPKVRSFVSDVGQGDWCIDLDELQNTNIKDRFGNILSISGRVQPKLGAIAAIQRAAAAMNLNILSRYLMADVA
jgi:polysaccharide pyruvyl transferase WcaK-like protein